jgi:Holliday junction resolvase RusA-like endonuclease
MIAAHTVGKRPPAPLKRAKLTLVRYSSVSPDFDGLVSSWKAPIDGLIHAGVIEDDSMEHIGVPAFHWEKAPPKRGKIFIGVEEMQS